jgi:hypothetical protein
VFSARVTLTGAGALGAKPSQQLLAAGIFDVKRGLAYERVDVPGPLDRNKLPPRDFLVFVRTKIFLSPAAQRALPSGKTTIVVPLTGADAAAAGAPRFAAQAIALTPLLLLDEIVAGGVKAARTGTEVLAHVPYVDYRVTVDLRRARRSLHGPFARAERRAIDQELAALGPGGPTVDVDMRTDSAGFVRQLHATVPGVNLGRIALELHGYGSTFTPSYPKSAQTVSLASLDGAWGWSPHWPWLLGS